MTDTCLICANSFTKKARAKITCPYCAFESCKECCQTYLLNETISKCMNSDCNREWTRHFISASFSANFIKNEYKKHREEILFNNERALLPSTQPIVEHELQKRKWQQDMEKVKNEITELNKEYMRLYSLINRVQNHNTRETERAAFVRACPVSECRGYLSTQWKCGICEKWTCPECHEIKGINRDVEHTCNPENVETAKLISQDTKSCPSCRTRIFKIDGCDQMWCTQCHTAFSWRTGRIESNIHNPHYYEWMRRTGGNEIQNQNMNQCQGQMILHHGYINDMLRMIRAKIHPNTMTVESQYNIDKNIYDFSNMCRSIIHIRGVDLPRFNYNYVLNNQELRVKYMMNEIDENKFKCLIQQNDKKYQKTREIHNVLQMFIDASSDIMFRFRRDVESPNYELQFDTLNELIPLIEYTNECFIEISKTYHSVALHISKTLKLVSI